MVPPILGIFSHWGYFCGSAIFSYFGYMFDNIWNIGTFGIFWHYSHPYSGYMFDNTWNILKLHFGFCSEYSDPWNILTFGIFLHYSQYSHPLWHHHMFGYYMYSHQYFGIFFYLEYSDTIFNILTHIVDICLKLGISWHYHMFDYYMFDNILTLVIFWPILWIYVWHLEYSDTILNILTHIVERSHSHLGPAVSLFHILNSFCNLAGFCCKIFKYQANLAKISGTEPKCCPGLGCP